MKDIIIHENKILRVKAVQLAGDFIDAEGNLIDSGNTLVDIVPGAESQLPEAEIRATCGY